MYVYFYAYLDFMPTKLFIVIVKLYYPFDTLTDEVIG